MLHGLLVLGACSCFSDTLLGAATRVPTVRALVAGSAADHDRPARRAWRRVLLILDCREGGGLRHAVCGGTVLFGDCRRMRRQTAIVELAAIHAGMELRFRRQELRS